MSNKTLGQIAYEAYCEKIGHVINWGKQNRLIQEAWEAAALAVAHEIRGKKDSEIPWSKLH